MGVFKMAAYQNRAELLEFSLLFGSTNHHVEKNES